MRVQFLQDHEEHKAGSFACVPPEMAATLIESGKAREPVVVLPMVKPKGKRKKKKH
jgi:hypothetical protein